MTVECRGPVLLSWSGGKDAAWALHVLRQDPQRDVVGLLTTLTDDDDRIAMQGIRRDVLRAQAHAVGLPVIESHIARHADNAAYERAWVDGLRAAAARWPGIAHVGFGDLLLADIRAYREALCARLGWTALFPLFGADTHALAVTMIASGLRAQLCCVDTTQLPASFAGRAFDATLLADLPKGVDRCGENGEFHTCACDGPMFTHPLLLERGETALRDGRFAYTDLRLRDR